MNKITLYVFFCVLLLLLNIMLWGPSMFLHMVVVLCFFSFAVRTPSYECSIIYLTIPLLMSNWVVSTWVSSEHWVYQCSYTCISACECSRLCCEMHIFHFTTWCQLLSNTEYTLPQHYMSKPIALHPHQHFDFWIFACLKMFNYMFNLHFTD